MNETYVECMVKRETKPLLKFFRYLLIALTVIVGLLGMASSSVVIFLFAILLGVGAYYMGMSINVEYEYLYVDREISIDKILNQTKRKKVAKYDVEKMEILAPVFSYKLDDYKNRKVKEKDYSSGVEKQPDLRYAFFYEGQEKVILEPSPEFVKAVYNVAPRKVFTS